MPLMKIRNNMFLPLMKTALIGALGADAKTPLPPPSLLCVMLKGQKDFYLVPKKRSRSLKLESAPMKKILDTPLITLVIDALITAKK